MFVLAARITASRKCNYPPSRERELNFIVLGIVQERRPTYWLVRVSAGRLRVHDDRRIAVAFAKVAQNLVVREVLSYDVNDVLNLSVKYPHHVLIGTVLLRIIAVVLGHLCG